MKLGPVSLFALLAILLDLCQLECQLKALLVNLFQMAASDLSSSMFLFHEAPIDLSFKCLDLVQELRIVLLRPHRLLIDTLVEVTGVVSILDERFVILALSRPNLVFQIAQLQIQFLARLQRHRVSIIGEVSSSQLVNLLYVGKLCWIRWVH